MVEVNERVQKHTVECFINSKHCKPLFTGFRRRNNRSLQKNRKASKPSICKQRHDLKPGVLVLYNCLVRWLKDMHCKGKHVILDSKKSVSVKKVRLLCFGKRVFAPIFPPVETGCILGGPLRKRRLY